MANDLQTPFTTAAAQQPEGSLTGNAELVGGYDFPNGRKESANLSGLPPLATVPGIQGQGDPGVGGSVPDKDLTQGAGTIPTGEPKY